MLKHVNLEEEHQVFDAGVAAYLLNPLKSTYTCEDLAREYEGGKMIPSREELLGKASFRKAWEEDRKGCPPMPLYSRNCAFLYGALKAGIGRNRNVEGIYPDRAASYFYS